MENTMTFDETFKSLVERYKMDEEKLRQNFELKAMMVDLYYTGKLHGIKELSQRLKDEKDVALS
jgi:hypothetical protein